MRQTRSFRGISRRLAISYLENLGGQRVDGEIDGDDEDEIDGEVADVNGEADDDWDVEGEGWQASLSEAKVGIGPSLQLNEVTVTFEGEDDALNELIPKFAQKAMRAGG